MAKIASLYGTTPAEIFESGLERNQEIEAVAACVLWKDGTVTAGWSNIDPRLLAYMIAALDQRFRRLHLDEVGP